MKAIMMTGQYNGLEGNVEYLAPFGKWSTLHIPGVAVIFKDKTFLRILDENNTN